MEKKIRTIKQASEAQLTVRQTENANPHFCSRTGYTKIFQKLFYGDISRVLRDKTI